MDEKNFDEDKIKIFDKNNSDNDSSQNKENNFQEESVTIQGKNVIKISSRSQERLFNIIDSTAEEEGNFTWRPEEKEVENHLFASSERQMSPAEELLAKTQRKEVPSRASRSRAATRRISKNKVQKKYPKYYYVAFYGIPILVLVILLWLVVKRYNDLNTPIPTQGKTNEEKMWESAKELYRKGYTEKRKAESFGGKNRIQALKFFSSAKKYYVAAVKKANQVLNIQIELEMSQKGIGREEATRYVETEFSYYKDKIDSWAKERDEISRIVETIQK